MRYETSMTIMVTASALAVFLPAGHAHGWQAARPRARAPSPAEIKRLDVKLEEARTAFLRETAALAASYENLGQLDRALEVLDVLRRLDPGNEQVRAKLDELRQRSLDAKEFEVTLDTADSWEPIGAVAKGRTLRIRVTGDYKLDASLTTNADGATGTDPQRDLIAALPLGAVMGVIIPPPAPGQGEAKPPRPFLVGSSFEKPADADGMLFLKVNVPPAAKCVGRLNVTVTGAEK